MKQKINYLIKQKITIFRNDLKILININMYVFKFAGIQFYVF